MPARRPWSLLVCLALALLTSCGSGDTTSETSCPDGSVITPDSACTPEPVTLSPDAVASEMSDEDLLLFCEQVRDAFMAFETESASPVAYCVGAGLGAKFSPDSDGEVATCELARDACLEESMGDESSGNELPSCEFGAFGLGYCDMTVAEFQTCADAILDHITSIQTSLNCEMSQEDAAEVEATAGDVSPEACGPAEAACPMLWDPGTSSP